MWQLSSELSASDTSRCLELPYVFDGVKHTHVHLAERAGLDDARLAARHHLCCLWRFAENIPHLQDGKQRSATTSVMLK